VKTASKFRLLEPGGRLVTVRFAGEGLELREGENLAAALLAAGVIPFRHTPVSGAPRNPYCMMGACFDCLVEIDGVTRQACMMEVKDGMLMDMPPAGEGRRA
jgi:D-hydroxyproline dehydrogenase subunit gamma